MALSLPTTQVAVAASRIGSPLAISSPSVAVSVVPSADSFGGNGRYHQKKRSVVCLYGPVLKSRVSDVREQEALSSAFSSPYQSAQLPFKQRQGSYSGTPDKEAYANSTSNSSALIDIEDSGDGSITFKYGAVEDLWDFDRLLEFLCGGAFISHTAEYFVRVVVELFKVPASYTAQRKLVDLLSAQIRLHNDVTSEEMEKSLSQILAEAASEFLPPSTVGSYRKGSRRPIKRFSSRLDKWWEKLDSYLGVGEGSVDFMPKHAFEEFGGLRMQSSGSYDRLDQRSDYKLFKPSFSPSVNTITSKFTWRHPPSQMPWLARPSDRLYTEAPKNSTLEILRENDSCSAREVGGGYISGLDFIMFSPQVDSLEDVLRKTEAEETAPSPVFHFNPPQVNDVDTLPIGSIQAMMEWEQEDMSVTSSVSLPSRSKSRVKVKSTKTVTNTTTRKKANSGTRASASTRSATKKKSHTDRRYERKLCDMFFALPISDKCSGVASFLNMWKNFGEELLVVLNQVAVGFAGAGLAVTLHVVARMLKVDSTFDASKLFGLIRGVSLLVLSAAMQSVRKVMLRLPAGGSVFDSRSKADLLCLQQRLRQLSFTAMTVMVLTVVGHGI